MLFLVFILLHTELFLRSFSSNYNSEQFSPNVHFENQSTKRLRMVSDKEHDLGHRASKRMQPYTRTL